MSEWKEYTGSDEQIAEMTNARNGWIARLTTGVDSYINQGHPGNSLLISSIISYWLIPADPLREMKIRWAMTAQRVFVRIHHANDVIDVFYDQSPNWNIPNAEYSFTPFKD